MARRIGIYFTALLLTCAIPLASSYSSPTPNLLSFLNKSEVALDVGDLNEAIHVEYPTYIQKSGAEYLYFSTYGLDAKWRISWASKNASEWVQHHSTPWGFEMNDFENIAFPKVVKYKSTYYLFFSGMGKGTSYYGRLLVSISSDLKVWSKPRTILIAPSVIDPDVIVTPKGFEVFFTHFGNRITQIRKVSFSQKLDQPSKASVLYSENTESKSFYTIFHVDYGKKRLWVIQRSNKWILACTQKDNLLHDLNGPVLLDGSLLQTEDKFVYGGEVFRFSEGEFLIFFNSIREVGYEKNGHIRSSKFPKAIFESYDLRKCI
jgi:hypothetical protein